MAQTNEDNAYITRAQQSAPGIYLTQKNSPHSGRRRDPTLQDPNYNLPFGSRPPLPSAATSTFSGQSYTLGSSYHFEVPMQTKYPPQWPLKEPRARLSDVSHRQPYYPPGSRQLDTPPQPTRPSASAIPGPVSQQRQPSFYSSQYGIYSRPKEIVEDHQCLPPASTFQDISHSEYQKDSSPHPRRNGPLVAPPPLSRRGLQSLYSNASYVSPIPEESFRSYGSHASGGAVPGSWGPIHSEEDHTDSRGTFHEESIHEPDPDHYESRDDDNLVRSASVGKKGKPSIVVTRSPSNGSAQPRVSAAALHATVKAPQALQAPDHPYSGLSEAANSPVKLPCSNDHESKAPPTQEVTLVMESTAESQEPSSSEVTTRRSSRPPTRRPPKLDLDAIRTAEARGSLTSLPDLIKRATRLAAMIDGGKRPASRTDNISIFLDEKLGSEDRQPAHYRNRSGLSDMLNAFPTPADRTRRTTWFRNTSWPRIPDRDEPRQGSDQKPRRRQCCGMSAWLVILMGIVLLCIVAAAIVIPLEIYVFKNLGNDGTESNLDQCKNTVKCQNGGLNHVSHEVCSCVCVNGYIGSNCSDRGTAACTATTISKADGSHSMINATMGDDISRLITSAENDFSIPLSWVDVLAKLNSADLSCLAQNSLVTLNSDSSGAADNGSDRSNSERSVSRTAPDSELVPIAVVTVTSTIMAVTRRDVSGSETAVNTEQLAIDTSVAPEAAAATAEPSKTDSAPQTSYTGSSQLDAFNITNETLDFARFAILYVLQETDLSGADYAQTQLQNFFTTASRSSRTSKSSAEGIRIGINMTANLVDLSLDLGNGKVGSS